MANEKILVVDDDPTVLKLLQLTLKSDGYNVVTAANGEEALEVANREEPDLIVSDIMMPQMDGVEFCWMIRENSKIPTVPFIFLTARSETEMELRGFRTGADDYIRKPFERKEFLFRVRSLLDKVSRVKKTTTHSEIKRVLSGDLAEMGLIDIIQVLDASRKSGILKVKSADKEGAICFTDGRMLDATVADLRGEEAVYSLLECEEGSFWFEPGDEQFNEVIKESTMNILMEGVRLLDEKNK